MKPKWQLITFILVHILLFLVVLNSEIYGDYFKSDFSVSYLYSLKIFQGQLPYIDFAVEYPPLALVFMILPHLVTSTFAAYAQAFIIQIMLFDLLGLFVIAALSQRLGLSLWKTLGIYTLALLAIGPIITIRHDLIPAAVVLLAIYTFTGGYHKTSWALLAVGMMIKLYPAIIAPIFLLYHRRRGQNRQAAAGVATFVITAAIITLPCLLLSPEGFWNSFTYHAGRGLQSESTYSSFLLLGEILGLTSVGIEISSGSLNVVSPLANTLARLSPLVMLLSLVATYWLFNRSQSGQQSLSSTPVSQSDIPGIINYSLLAIVAFIITSKVFSPQYIIWLYPLIPLVVGRWRNASWLMFIMVGLMTYFVYPKYYGGLEEGVLLVVVILFLRNVSLMIMAFLLSRPGSRVQPSGS